MTHAPPDPGDPRYLLHKPEPIEALRALLHCNHSDTAAALSMVRAFGASHYGHLLAILDMDLDPAMPYVSHRMVRAVLARLVELSAPEQAQHLPVLTAQLARYTQERDRWLMSVLASRNRALRCPSLEVRQLCRAIARIRSPEAAHALIEHALDHPLSARTVAQLIRGCSLEIPAHLESLIASRLPDLDVPRLMPLFSTLLRRLPKERRQELRSLLGLGVLAAPRR